MTPDPVLQFHGMALTRRLLEVHSEPVHAKAAIAGTLASIVSGFDDDLWEKIMDVSKMPCGIPDCDCEIYGEKFFEGLNAGREHHKRVMAKWDKAERDAKR
jgi:hypothetical protein